MILRCYTDGEGEKEDGNGEEEKGEEERKRK